MTDKQRIAIVTPVAGLMVWCSNCGPYGELQIYNGKTWKNVTGGAVSCGSSLTITHNQGNISPVTKTVNYGTVVSTLDGFSKCWITQNLGADQQAASSTDATEASAGWYWQFNRKQGFKYDSATLAPSWTTTSINENINWTSANDPCAIELGSGWRIPTSTEWTSSNAGIDGSGKAWTGTGGTNPNWSSPLWLHAAGRLDKNGVMLNRGISGYYWSSTTNNLVDASLGFYQYFTNGSSTSSFKYGKACGLSVRCIKDL